jgi:hypothetical protein
VHYQTNFHLFKPLVNSIDFPGWRKHSANNRNQVPLTEGLPQVSSKRQFPKARARTVPTKKQLIFNGF